MNNSGKNPFVASVKPFNVQQSSQEVLDLATSYTQTYVNHVENVPFDLQKKVTRLREIDMACQDHVSKVESLYETFVQKKEETNVKLLIQMQRLLARCKELGDEKISITEEVNEILESKNRTLDSEKRQFLLAHDPDNKELHNGKRESSGKYDGGKSIKRPRRSNHHQHEKHINKYEKSYMDVRSSPMMPSNTTPAASTSATPAVEDRTTKRSVKSTRERKEDKKEKKEEVKLPSSKTTETSNSPTSTIIPSISATSMTNNKQTANKTNEKKAKKKKRKAARQSERQASEPVSPLMDIPIDPDEPTYCVCNQVSFGQMIGCDNKKCPIEWFHFSCVGLTNKPKGNWYCSDCLQKKDKKKDKRDK